MASKITDERRAFYLNQTRPRVLAHLWKMARNATPGERPRRVSGYRLGLMAALPGDPRKRESIKRRMRELRQVMEEAGDPILGVSDGYYLATEPGDFADYRRLRSDVAKRLLARLGRLTATRTEAGGQITMFLDPPEPLGAQ